MLSTLTFFYSGPTYAVTEAQSFYASAKSSLTEENRYYRSFWSFCHLKSLKQTINVYVKNQGTCSKHFKIEGILLLERPPNLSSY